MIHEANGAKFIAADDMIVSFEHEKQERFEPVTRDWIFEKMADGGVFLDVGAATGWYSVPLALRGCEVHAVEPHRAVATRLEQNAALNGAKIKIYRAAASRERGRTAFRFNAQLPLTSGGSIEEGGCIAPTGKAMVDTIRVDDLSLAPRLIKVDVEGHELAVLGGAAQTIAEHRPFLVLEANTDAHAEPIRRWLAPMRYDAVVADKRNLLCTPSS